MATEAEVLALLDKKMEEAKADIIKEMSDYFDWHLEKYGLTYPTEATYREFKELKANATR